MQQPTGQPNWPTPQPIPPRRRRGFLRNLSILVCAAVGLMIGGMAGSALAVVNFDLAMVGVWVGMLGGLTLGTVFGFWVTNPRHRPVDPGQYPNRIFRRV